MLLSEILLITFILLFLAMIVASLCRHIPVPYTVLLVILGLLINFSEPFLPTGFSISDFQLTNELVLFVFLPALIFESALCLDARGLLKNILPVLVLAIPGLVISLILVGLGLWFSLDVPILIALLFGALISATDPVAVVALFKELGVPRRLMILVEGEALLNDATAIVLFNILLAFVLSNSLSADSLLPIIPEFLKVFLGGILVGAVIALVMTELMVRYYHGDNSIPVIMSMCLAYFSFIVAEHGFHVSGVMAVLTAAICLNISGLMRLSNETAAVVSSAWEVFVLICNSLLFIMIGLSANIYQLAEMWQAILLAVIAVNLARALSVYLLVPLATRCFKLPSISFAERHIMWWGGLKGGLAIAIVLSIPNELAEKQMLINLTVGVVLISLLLNATTVGHLLTWLKLDRLSNNEWAEFQQSREKIKHAADDVLKEFVQMNLLTSELQNSVEDAFGGESKQLEPSLTINQRIQQVQLTALQAEKNVLEYLHEIGVINHYTFLSLKDLLRRVGERLLSIDVNQGRNKSVNKETPKINNLVKFELFVIRFLGERNWAQGLLVKYQESRFSNRIQHDIASVLIAREGFKVIEENETRLGTDALSEIKKEYQDRLKRRQAGLDEFKEMYPEFYDQFEYFLFQKVALKYSLRLVNEEYEANKLSAKVYTQLQSCLQTALDQLPKMKQVLQLDMRDDWINQVPLFSGLPEDDLKQLSTNSRYVNLLSGDTLFNENDRGVTMYIIVSGQLSIFKKNAEGVSEYIAELDEGGFVGEHALLDNSRRSATVRAKTYVTLLRLTADDVIRLSKKLPELKLRLEAAELIRAEQRDAIL